MFDSEAKRIAHEAKRKGMWLYDPSYHKWYSPEDFEHIFTYANASAEFLKQLQMKDPKEGIEAGFMRLADLQNKLKTFVKLVNEYYEKK